MKRSIKFVGKVISALPPAPADGKSREVEYSGIAAPPGLRLVVNRRGNKTWLLRYSMPAPSGSSSTEARKRAIKLGEFPTMDPAAAIAKAGELRAKIAAGTDPLAEKAAHDDSPTLDAFFKTTYWPHIKDSLRSAYDIESLWRRHLNPEFGHLKFAELKTAEILRFHDAKKTATCAASANRMLAALRRIVNVAIMLDLCEKNPTRGIRMHAESNIRTRTLAGVELKRFLAALAEEPNRVAADYFLFTLACGCRREESLQMKFPEVEMQERIWRIPASRSKNGRSRIVPLNDVAMEVLERRRRSSGGEYVFPGNSGKHLVNPTKAFRRILDRAAIGDLKIHDLRRSAATLILNTGQGSVTEAQHLLGHRHGSITEARYAFLSDNRVREASQRLAAVLSEARGQVPA